MGKRIAGVVALLVLACSSGSEGGSSGLLNDAVMDPGIDPATDSAADAAVEDPGSEPIDPHSTADVGEEVVEPAFPQRGLPFEITRDAEGDPMTPAEVTAFTKKVTGLWKDIDWARWVLRTSEGVDASTGKADFLGWYNDVTATKDGDTVTFACRGGEHNMWINGSLVLSEAIAGYLLTGDWTWGKLAEQYCKGLGAVIKGFVWDEDDPAPFLMARSIFPQDNSFVMDAESWRDDGRKKVVTFHDMYHNEDGWNAHTFAWPHNPTWGEMYVTNMRSKDDVRSIVRTTTFLPYLLEDAKDDFVREACEETMELLRGFNKDIVDSGYNIRTKGPDGVAYVIPCSDQDLGSYSCYTAMDPTNECCQRLTADFIGYGEPKTEECGNCFGSLYDGFASAAHFYNIPIIWDYHMAAVGLALVHGENDMALKLMEGLKLRIDSYVHPSEYEPGPRHHGWFKELAVMLVQAASMGMPLTWLEARIIHDQWSHAVDELRAFPNWDPWSAEVPDGEVAFRPRASDDGIDIAAITMFLEYCNSPFRNPAGVPFVDCDVVADMSSWGE